MRSIGNLSATNWRDLPAIARGLVSMGGLLDGNSIGRYEAAFESLMEGGHAVSFRAGRHALSAILKAAGLKAGDELLITGFTCVVMPNAAIFQGIRPVYVDIDPWTYNMAPDDIERNITPRTRAILLQSSFGLPPDYDRLIEIARAHKLFVIEDDAPSVGARYRGRPVGVFGDASVFSSEQSKSISTAKGGIAYTRDEDLASAIRAIQAQTAWPDAKRVRQELGYLANLALIQGPRMYHYKLPDYYLRRLGLIFLSEWQGSEWTCTEPPGYMQRLPNAHARVGLSQLRQLPAFLDHRARISQRYDDFLPSLGYRPPTRVEGAEAAIVTYPVLVKDPDHIRAFLSDRRIFAGNWFQAPIHPAVVDPADAFYRQGQCPQAEKVCRHIINLPTTPRMNMADVDRLFDALREYQARYPDHAPDVDDPHWPLND